MKTRPGITDEEIRGYMDFDRLLEKHQQASVSHTNGKTKYIWILGLLLGLGILAGIKVFNNSTNAVQAPTTTSTKATTHPQQQMPAIAPGSTTIHKNDSIRPQDLPTVSPKQKAKFSPASESSAPVVESDNTVEKNADQPTAQQALNPVYVQAEPVNGYPHLYEYFSRELNYPEEAKKDSIRGEVIAVFTINASGTPEKILIENSLGPVFDREVVRLITNMPPWKPATYNDKPVSSKMSLPLTFQIKKIVSQK